MAQKANQPIRWKERIGIMAIGHSFKQVEEWVFDFALYPAVIAWLGALKGGLVMTAFSASECLFLIFIYDRTKKDWFGFELVKEVRDGEEKQGRVVRFIQYLARKSNWLAFLVLSAYTDPFMTTVYMRKGAEAYNGLSRRDWGIFWGSVLVANLWWTTAMTFAVAGVRLFFHRLGFINRRRCYTSPPVFTLKTNYASVL